jgi:hypothetical protein
MNSTRQQLIAALERAAAQIEHGAPYQWGHVGQCNVGHVVQNLAHLSDREIMAAFGRTLTEWRDHAAEYFDAAVGDEPLATTESQRDYCPQISAPLEQIYRLFAEAGLNAQDIGHLEFLSDERVLARLGRKDLRRNSRQDAALYLRTYAQLLSEHEHCEQKSEAAYICA